MKRVVHEVAEAAGWSDRELCDLAVDFIVAHGLYSLFERCAIQAAKLEVRPGLILTVEERVLLSLLPEGRESFTTTCDQNGTLYGLVRKGVVRFVAHTSGGNLFMLTPLGVEAVSIARSS